jgi:hypothetical protein
MVAGPQHPSSSPSDQRGSRRRGIAENLLRRHPDPGRGPRQLTPIPGRSARHLGGRTIHHFGRPLQHHHRVVRSVTPHDHQRCPWMHYKVGQPDRTADRWKPDGLPLQDQTRRRGMRTAIRPRRGQHAIGARTKHHGQLSPAQAVLCREGRCRRGSGSVEGSLLYLGKPRLISSHVAIVVVEAGFRSSRRLAVHPRSCRYPFSLKPPPDPQVSSSVRNRSHGVGG